ncbi:MAG: hypothetical protein C0619_07295 [Desulfuromonas sp.]|nr:MAG: hypothetical protein C0619_07295 [Desulfuromonas sp.]
MKKLVFILFLIAALGLIATTTIAGKAGMMCNSCPQQGFAAGEIEKKYAADYAAIEQKLMAKQEEMRAAWGQENTTVGEINRLRNEMLELKKEYLVLNDKVQRESAELAGGNITEGSAGCAKGMGGCDKQGMYKQGCGKKGGKMKCPGGDDCPKQGCGRKCDQANCKAGQDCPKKERCDMQGKKCRGEIDCRGKGDCPKRS